jgi:hypothetical protein
MGIRKLLINYLNLIKNESGEVVPEKGSTSSTHHPKLKADEIIWQNFFYLSAAAAAFLLLYDSSNLSRSLYACNKI